MEKAGQGEQQRSPSGGSTGGGPGGGRTGQAADAGEEVGAEGADAGGVAHPTLHGKEQPGLFTRALEAAEDLAATAAGKLKHGTQLATGTAPEQRPADQLTALQDSIAQMEQERAEDVAYRKAKKELGM